jgi:RNA polymerase sigma-70 factor (ECF subfamily)
MTPASPDTDQLLDHAAHGDEQARQQLLMRHRDRLRRMVAFHLDRRLAARVDPSDVVQETLDTAARNLDEYLRNRPIPFYPWLRQLAWDRLVKVRRHHIYAGIRSVTREEPGLPDESAGALASRLAASMSTPSMRVARAELLARVRDALTKLTERDREVLVMRYMEQLSTREIAAALGIREGAVRARHMRALDHLRRELGVEHGEDL